MKMKHKDVIQGIEQASRLAELRDTYLDYYGRARICRDAELSDHAAVWQRKAERVEREYLDIKEGRKP